MHFCRNCDNMYYINVSDDSQSIYHFCRNCGDVNNDILLKSSIIYEENTKVCTSYKLINAINQYTKYDPTLPRLNNIKCPNDNCPSNKDKLTPEVLYIKYDEDNIKFLYLCYHCDKSWHNGQ